MTPDEWWKTDTFKDLRSKGLSHRAAGVLVREGYPDKDVTNVEWIRLPNVGPQTVREIQNYLLSPNEYKEITMSADLMANRPKVTAKMTSTKQVDFTLDETMVIEALMNYLRKHFPEFRGFANDEIELDFHELNGNRSIKVSAYRERNNNG